MADRRYDRITDHAEPTGLYRKTNSKMKKGKCYYVHVVGMLQRARLMSIIYQSSPVVDQRIKMDHRCTVHVYIPT